MRLALPIYAVAMSSAMLMQIDIARADGFTTRIETRPYHGAVTTLEHGVRVIRPLPPERYVIVNPNRTPLSLSFNESTIYSQSIDGFGDGDRSRGSLGAANPDGPIYTRPSYGPRRWQHGHRSGHMKHGFPGKFGNGAGPKGAPGAIGAH